MRISASAIGMLLALALLVPLSGCSSKEEQLAEHLASARQELAGGDLRAAVIELRSALKLDPKSSEVNLLLGQTLFRMDHKGDAVFFYREAMRLDPRNDEAALLLAALLIFDEKEEAERLIAGVLARDPGNANAYVVRSRVELVKEDLDAALQAVLTATQLAPDQAAGFDQLGRVYVGRVRAAQILGERPLDDDYVKGIGAFGRAAELQPETGWVFRLELAKLYGAWQGHGHDARSALDRAFDEAVAQAGPSGEVGASALVSIRRAAGLMNHLELERRTLELQVAQNPEAIRGWLRLASLAGGEEGDAVMSRMLELQPDDPDAHAMYVGYLRRSGRVEEGLAHLEKTINEISEPAELQLRLLNLYRGRGRPEDAARVVADMQREAPNSPQTVLAVGMQAIHEGRTEEAAVALREVVGRIEDVDAWRLLARVESELGRPEAALAAVDRAVEVAKLTGAPFPQQAITLRARLQYAGRDWLGTLRSLINLTQNGVPLDESMLLMKSGSLYEIRRVAAARRALRPLLEREPPDPLAVLMFARYESARAPERTRELVARAHEVHKAHPALVGLVVRQQLTDGDFEGALAAIEAAIAAGRVTPGLLEQRARVYAAQGRVEAALGDALAAFEADPRPRTASLLVSLYQADGRLAEAIASFEEAEAVGALKPGIRVLLGRMHLAEGNRERARELYESALSERSDLLLAKNDLAYLLAQEGADLDRALTLAEEAQRGLSRRPEVADTLGFVYLKKGLLEPAVQQFRFAIELSGSDGGSPVVHYHLGLALRELGRAEEAAAEFELALAKREDFEEAAAALEALEAEAELSRADAAAS